MPAVTQVRIENVTPARLVKLVLAGRIRLPSFQRDYRWHTRDVENLFDSVRKSYPIGNLLLWERPAPADRITIGPLVLDVPQVQQARWVVDGQQRITSLVGALAAPEGVTDPRFTIYVHLPTMEFRASSRPPAGPWLPLRSAGSAQHLLAWQRDHAEFLGDEEFAAAGEVAAALQEYPIPSYIVEADDERELRVVFDRMNNYGRTLRKEEVFDALHGMQGSAEPGDLGAVGASIAAAGFGRLKDGDVLRSLLAIRDPDIFRGVHDEFENDGDRRRAFKVTEHVLLDVVASLRGDLFIPHVRVLPYPSVIPLLAALVHRFGRPTGRTAALVRRWFWRGAALGANPAGNVPLVRRTLRAVAAATTSQEAALALLAALPDSPRRWQPDLTQVHLNRALTRVNLLGLIGLGPKELLPAGTDLPLPNPVIAPGELLDTEDSPLVRMVASRVDHPLAATMANRILHPPVAGDVVQTLLRADPTVRASHAVDDECSALLAAGQWVGALTHRADVLSASIAELVDEQAEWGARDRFTSAELLGTVTLSA
ncbi:MAG: DUF262 domain-containing protein [Pseudonocardia sp.]